MADKYEVLLKEFIKAFSGSLDPRLWISLIKEELEEVKAEEINTEAHLKELTDLTYVFAGLATVCDARELGEFLPEEELEAFDKLMHSLNWAFEVADSLYGEEVMSEAFKRVHESNMSKLGEDGKPILREDGKVLKGPNYKAPDLSDLIEGKTE